VEFDVEEFDGLGLSFSQNIIKEIQINAINLYLVCTIEPTNVWSDFNSNILWGKCKVLYKSLNTKQKDLLHG
jgi:hypothetical protein